MKFVSHSAEETQKLAQDLAGKYQSGAVIALIGDLGAGKTTFAQGFAQGLGITQKLISPTFVLMRQYTIPGKTNGLLFHIDLYRLDNISQIKQLGIEEIFQNPQNIILIEWAEKLENLLPKDTIRIEFQTQASDQREIEIKE